MNNLQDKVKDIVEAGTFRRLLDFSADPARTLGRYHFTDVTSDLMGKWLDRIATYQGQNSAFALAGYRGVGKSHFLAALTAVLSHPDLRSRITDPHVQACAQRLRRRSYLVANIKRGLRETLVEELSDAVAAALAVEPSTLGSTIPEILDKASDKAGDTPFVLIVDTASEREARVARDDGEDLSEIARAAADRNVFLAVALDDDIADADGINSSIARTFTIDYLDQEHLYKIVDAFVFPKQSSKRPVIHEVYEYFRSVLPGFRWSEQKFTALYPMHPVLLEVAPFVRFYVQDFALLGFAAEASEKVMGRPGHALIVLDEVFDSVEEQLRARDDLKESLEAYDALNEKVIKKLPVMKRLHGKLVLKALLLLSLDGNGKTADELMSAMLIVDEKNPQQSAQYVEELLASFVAALPDDIQRVQEEGREPRYSFKLRIKDDLNEALQGAIAAVPDDVVPKILRKAMRERFSDCTFSDDEQGAPDWMDCQVSWRGGYRRGRLIWESGRGPDSADVPHSPNLELIDWELAVHMNESGQAGAAPAEDIPRSYWRSAPLRPDEVDALKRSHILASDVSLREGFSSQYRSSSHAHKLEVEKIFERSFLTDGRLIVEDTEFEFSETARSSEKLSDLLSIMLEPLFEKRYPEHPTFARQLGMNEVSILATELFSGSGQNSAEVQQLAEIFALPLGLVTRRGELLVPESEDKLVELPIAKEILQLLDADPSGLVSIKTIYQHLKRSAHGLVREAQQLILTALVSRRQIEFVTTKGDRISRRSLDLKIIWGDIEAVARPAGRNYSAEELTFWVRTLAGNESLGNSEPEIRGALAEWLAMWKELRILERFNELPDEILNTRIWRVSIQAKNSFGAVAEAVTSLLDDAIPLDEGLHRISDAFADSKEEFVRCSRNLEVIEDFIAGAARREEIRTYLALCEPTGDEKIEALREELAQIIDASYFDPSELYNQEMEVLWVRFRTMVSEKFAASHDAIMRSHHLQEKFDEIQRSDQWWEFENLSHLPIVETIYWQQAKSLCRELRQLDCRFDVTQMMQIHPFCACSFSLGMADYWKRLPDELSGTIENGLRSYRRTLSAMGDRIVSMINDLSHNLDDEESKSAAARLIESIGGEREFSSFSTRELQILRKVFENSSPLEPVIEVPADNVDILDAIVEPLPGGGSYGDEPTFTNN
jgi:hypothetical protein